MMQNPAPAACRPSTAQDLRDLIGKELGPTQWHTVDQERISDFAELTGDQQWIHVDPVRAAHGPFGSTIAHGLYSLSRTPWFIAQLIAFDGFAHGLNYGYGKIRFLHPLAVNSRIRMRAEVIAVDEASPGQINLTTKITVEADGLEKPILVAESIGRFTER